MTTTIDRTRQAGGSVGLLQGSALYIASVLGTGILVLPALAAELAGPASIVAVAAVLLLSIPLAGTFAALAARYPDAGGCHPPEQVTVATSMLNPLRRTNHDHKLITTR